MRLFQSMLLAVDGSPASDAALAVACSLATEYGGMVTGRHVLAMNPHLSGRHIQWLPEVEADKRREASAIVRRAEDKAANIYGIPLRIQLVDGDPIEELLNAADAIAADTIVIGNRGQSALSTLILGSVAQGVTQRSVLPVLVVHDATSIGGVAVKSMQTAKLR